MKKVVLSVLLLISPAVAQQSSPAPAPAQAAPAQTAPATNLDAFLSQTGVLTVRESLGSKSVPALYGATVRLEAVKIYTPGRENNAVMGIALNVRDGERYSTTRIEFVEMGEIGDMIKAVEYMVAQAPKANTAVSPEFKFTSKSDAVVGVFYGGNGFSGVVKAGNQSAYLSMASIDVLRQSLVDLQAVLK